MRGDSAPITKTAYIYTPYGYDENEDGIADATQKLVELSFDANGGEGEMTPATVTYGEQYTLPECGFTAPDDLLFRGWQADDDAQTVYQPGDTAELLGEQLGTVIEWVTRDAMCQSTNVQYAGGAANRLALTTSGIWNVEFNGPSSTLFIPESCDPNGRRRI